jgi:membrane protein implicated in regulation of membrane protease activity
MRRGIWADQNTYALALAALGIAVIGIVAAVQTQLGGDWWVPIPGLAVTSIVALLGTRRARARLGPDPVSFYEAFATTSTQVSRGIEKCRSIGIEKCRSVVGGAG